MEGKNYWLFIEQFIHISIKGENILLYHPFTGKLLLYENVPEITGLMKRLDAVESLRVTGITGKELAGGAIAQFVSDLRDNFMGDLMDKTLSAGKPVQMVPLLYFNKGTEHLRMHEGVIHYENLIQYLSEITMYINGSCDLDCEICTDACRQYLCCTRNTQSMELKLSRLRPFLEPIHSSYLSSIIVSGGDIFLYSELENLARFLEDRAGMVKYAIHFRNLLSGAGKIDLINFSNTSLQILVPFPCEKSDIVRTEELLKAKKLNHQFNFVIQKNEEYDLATELISSCPISSFSFHPHYNGTNEDFFRENIYVTREDIMEAKSGLMDIHLRKTINIHNHGKLFIQADGRVFAGLNSESIGHIAGDRIDDILYREMSAGKSWRKLRKNVRPCNQCNFNALCPPLTGYEHVIGKNNLCMIHP